MKIISLVPSITELLFTLGLDDEVVGITKFCVRPKKWFQSKIKIGGTKNINTDKIKGLNPDLIIANKEENIKEQVQELAKSHPVYLTDVNNHEEALQMILDIGKRVGRLPRAKEIVATIEQAFMKSPPIKKKITAVYLIWKKPWMTVGGDTFIHSMMEKAGYQNVFAYQTRYPSVTIEEIKQLSPQYILLSSEPYPFKEKHIAELQPQFPHAKIILVNGEMFSWYGSRMQHATAYFESLK